MRSEEGQMPSVVPEPRVFPFATLLHCRKGRTPACRRDTGIFRMRLLQPRSTCGGDKQAPPGKGGTEASVRQLTLEVGYEAIPSARDRERSIRLQAEIGPI